MRKLLLVILTILLALPALAEPPFKMPRINELRKIRGGIMETDQGTIYFKLFPEDAPWHVANFKYLADQKFYDGLKIHIFQQGYLLQMGTPNENPAGGPPYTLPPEFNSNRHVAGALSMVRRPDYLDIEHKRNSHGSQFRIMLKDTATMDGQYVVFGQVIKGFEVINHLRLNDRIKSLRVYVQE